MDNNSENRSKQKQPSRLKRRKKHTHTFPSDRYPLTSIIPHRNHHNPPHPQLTFQLHNLTRDNLLLQDLEDHFEYTIKISTYPTTPTINHPISKTKKDFKTQTNKTIQIFNQIQILPSEITKLLRFPENNHFTTTVYFYNLRV